MSECMLGLDMCHGLAKRIIRLMGFKARDLDVDAVRDANMARLPWETEERRCVCGENIMGGDGCDCLLLAADAGGRTSDMVAGHVEKERVFCVCLFAYAPADRLGWTNGLAPNQHQRLPQHPLPDPPKTCVHRVARVRVQHFRRLIFLSERLFQSRIFTEAGASA